MLTFISRLYQLNAKFNISQSLKAVFVPLILRKGQSHLLRRLNVKEAFFIRFIVTSSCNISDTIIKQIKKFSKAFRNISQRDCALTAMAAEC